MVGSFRRWGGVHRSPIFDVPHGHTPGNLSMLGGIKRYLDSHYRCAEITMAANAV